MNVKRGHLVAAAILVAALLLYPVAHAQLGDLLKKPESGASVGGLGGLGDIGGAMSGQSLTSGSVGNVAGLLEFCIKNNYLGGNQAASVKDSLLGKLPSGSSPDSGYSSGAKGILTSSSGSQLDLGGGGMKKQVTKQICDKVLEQGKSMR